MHHHQKCCLRCPALVVEKLAERLDTASRDANAYGDGGGLNGLTLSGMALLYS